VKSKKNAGTQLCAISELTVSSMCTTMIIILEQITVVQQLLFHDVFISSHCSL